MKNLEWLYSKKISISSHAYLILLLSIQATVLFLLFVVVKGSHGLSLSPVQPDSFKYICKALEIGRYSNQTQQEFLGNLNSYLGFDNPRFSRCPEINEYFKSRYLLPYAIAIFLKLGPWWIMFLPTIIFSILSIIFWWVTTKKVAEYASPLELILLFSPWLSMHTGLYSSLLLTEGPLLLIVLGTILIAKTQTSKPIFLSTLLIITLLGLSTRQSWPIFALICAYLVVEKYSIRSIWIIPTYLVSSIVAFSMSSLLINRNDPHQTFAPIMEGFRGIRLAIFHDSIHIITHLDIFWILMILGNVILWIEYNHMNKNILGLGLVLVSLLNIMSVYLYDQTYGQNWRYFHITFMLITLINLRSSKIKVNQGTSNV